MTHQIQFIESPYSIFYNLLSQVDKGALARDTLIYFVSNYLGSWWVGGV